MPSDKPRRRLEDIIENIDRVQQYTRGYDCPRFLGDRLCEDAVERCLPRTSEAAKKLEGVVDALAPGAPWFNIRAVGNVPRHEYDDTDQAIIWKIVTGGLPPQKIVTGGLPPHRLAVEAALSKLATDDRKTP